MSVYFYYGDEEFLIEEEITKLRNKVLDENFASMNFKNIKCPKYPDLVSVLSTQPMMFGNQMFVIDIGNYFLSGTEGSVLLDEKQVKELSVILENIPKSLYIIFKLEFEKNSKRKPDSRKKIYKIISKVAKLQEFSSIPSYKIAELSSFVNKVAKNNDVVFEKAACEKLIEQVGNNLRELTKEIEKLALTIHPNKKVSEKHVKEYCIVNEDIFSLTDKLFTGKKASALLEFRQLCEKQFPLLSLAAIQTSLRKSIMIKMFGKKVSNSELAKMTGMNEFVIPHRINALKDSNLKELIKLKRNLTECEYRIKSGQAMDVQKEIETAFFK